MLLFVLFGAVSLACGGGDDADDGSNRLRYEVSRLTQLVTDLLGDDAGFDAIVFAFERGYSPAQVIQAIEDASLRQDGLAEGLSPGGQPLGLVVLPDSTTTRNSGLVRFAAGRLPPNVGRALAAHQEPPLLIEVLRDHARRESEKLSSEELDLPLHTYLLLGWLAAGYSPDQVIEALILGERYERASQDCMAIMDSSGRVVFPTGDSPLRFSCTSDFVEWDRLGPSPSLNATPADDADEEDEAEAPPLPTPAPESAASDLAGTYVGEMTLYQCTVTCDTQCEVHGPITIRLMPDGRVIGSTGASADFRGTVCVDPLGVGPPISGMWEPSSDRLDITVEAAIGTVGPVILSLIVEGSEATVTLLQDTREGDQARIVQLDAVLTRQ